ncbi:hypothetical protein GF407_10140, partial [candidate division KSB1 bacterium]|nr:hypothetical protein [candidate division KSB1 bacterium]
MKRIILLLFVASAALASGDSAFNQVWKLIPSMSSDVNRYTRSITLDIRLEGDEVTLIRHWGRRGRIDTLNVIADGNDRRLSQTNRNNLTTIYTALHTIPGEARTIAAEWQDQGRTLVIEQTYEVEIQQGKAELQEEHVFQVSKNRDFLTYRISRPSRPHDPMLEYKFKVRGSLHAYAMHLQNDWRIKGDLQRQALLIGLQGLVNRDDANLYFIYPEDWQFTYSGRLYEWYQDERGYDFTILDTPAEALSQFRDHVKGYVVWDKEVRTSLIVAYTVAGLEDAIVASEAQISMLDSLGFSMVEDFRGKFTGMNDAEIYSWAKDQYWHRCSRTFLIWLGGHAGKVMKPGVADWGVTNRVFFQDLSTDPEDSAEYNLAKELLADMSSKALIMGWHSYGKDLESQHVTLCSSFGLPVLGLHSNPNISFEHQIGFSEGFEFKNHHNIEPDKTYTPEKKVYLACIQTDGIGIGAWLKPGRGEIPYAWETLMNYSWL